MAMTFPVHWSWWVVASIYLICLMSIHVSHSSVPSIQLIYFLSAHRAQNHSLFCPNYLMAIQGFKQTRPDEERTHLRWYCFCEWWLEPPWCAMAPVRNGRVDWWRILLPNTRAWLAMDLHRYTPRRSLFMCRSLAIRSCVDHFTRSREPYHTVLHCFDWHRGP